MNHHDLQLQNCSWASFIYAMSNIHPIIFPITNVIICILLSCLPASNADIFYSLFLFFLLNTGISLEMEFYLLIHPAENNSSGPTSPLKQYQVKIKNQIPWVKAPHLHFSFLFFEYFQRNHKFVTVHIFLKIERFIGK